jgi:alpha-beta hydrolase superfamily lysophospholipase
MTDATRAAAVVRSETAVEVEKVPWISRKIAWGALHAGLVAPPRLLRYAYGGKMRRRGGEVFRVAGAQGVELECVHLPPTPAADRPEGVAAGERPLTVFIMHGWLECKELHLFRAYALQDAGHRVVLIDHRGHGGSDAVGVTFGVYERDDLRAVINEANARGWLGEAGRAITMGHSMGAATVLMHAADDQRVAGVVAMAPYATITGAIKAFRHKLPLVRYVYPLRWTLGGFAYQLSEMGGSIDGAEPLRAVHRITAPVLLIEAGRDTLVPREEHTQALMDADRGGPMERVHIEKANHFTLSRVDRDAVRDRVLRFCREVSDAVAHDVDPTAAVIDHHTESFVR